ncbi:cAMP-specific 3',5'-cyclic phosphodiesterase 4D-like [Artibeus jamaicensis]|uniref:cAMP-specific 3',5'-cyclic phosphodiesterase 4D-like n=1 Tax=Artibeus jamaicensis TaxID=9417 RepID=UPI00235B2FF4|nr:cAMP-specific 3',5'-cyclic phosphodiesterase 4D-like [Artibeus jamaicensis]XP_053513187.1 cAMP-specific 3',5'-cyclic phosphodiesterase 4D-like [Artibeus jamaicensis]XP_053513188.1 cAMP-specific 3',5'-cyclic phosphodiesterase 4D-like [Artibeus jamaicensis]XP_053513189.1 cAMP-specific 3',5'-cyclic phosphodiesterase 4D-like [Artibeus jamaicensis]XP_053513190.1 cAMP-specific 3',5'-cyclic phosphodiesterase 4D-like [Artibeus jamaicensis]
MKRNTCDLLSRSKSASEETLHSSKEEEDPFRGMEPYLVRRLSCRNVQLPPLAFRQLEQADLKSESENIQRPTSLPLKILPLIAITSADSTGNLEMPMDTRHANREPGTETAENTNFEQKPCSRQCGL